MQTSDFWDYFHLCIIHWLVLYVLLTFYEDYVIAVPNGQALREVTEQLTERDCQKTARQHLIVHLYSLCDSGGRFSSLRVVMQAVASALSH